MSRDRYILRAAAASCFVVVVVVAVVAAAAAVLSSLYEQQLEALACPQCARYLFSFRSDT